MGGAATTPRETWARVRWRRPDVSRSGPMSDGRADVRRRGPVCASLADAARRGRPRRQRREAQRLAHGRERPSVDGAGAEPVERAEVGADRIALVLREAVARVCGVQLAPCARRGRSWPGSRPPRSRGSCASPLDDRLLRQRDVAAGGGRRSAGARRRAPAPRPRGAWRARPAQ